MISNAIGTALSGMRAAELRMQNSASNVANVNTTGSRDADGNVVNQPYRASDVVQTSQPAGVRADIVERATPTVQTFNPNDPAADDYGMVESPNVNLEEEVAQQITASYDYKANLKVIKTADEMLDSLLNIIT